MRAGEPVNFCCKKHLHEVEATTSYQIVFLSAMATTPLMELTVKLDEPVFVKLPTDQPGCELNTSPFFLTNIDQMLAFTVETLYFYGANAEKGSETVAETLREALGKVLVHYDFLAGRVRVNEATNRMEIDRNNAGVQVASASCALTMAQLGDVAQPNPLFRKFLPQARHAATLADVPLLMLQVTTLACGGHVLAFAMSHLLWDGHGVVQFLFNLMSLARGGPLLSHPQPDRSMLRARIPPTPTFHHPEYLKLDSLPPPTSFTTSTAAASQFVPLTASANHITKIVPFSAGDLVELKRRAMEGGVVGKRVSTFEALAGHVWQARVRAMEEVPESEVAQLLYAVDIRERMEPALPAGFCGNAIYSGCARAACGEVRRGPLGMCVREVQRANERVTDAFVRSGIDWWEVYRGVPALPSGIYITSWQKMPFYSIDFGWGTPLFAGPAVTPMVEFVVFLPSPKQDGGLHVILCLEPHVMRKFQSFAQVSP